MANDHTNIGWCDATWNPVTGCSKVSAGCKNCYAADLAPRLAAMGQKGYTALPWTARNAAENVKLHPDRLEKPLRWRKPRRVFVNSMSDLFHEQVPEEFIDRVFAVMALSPEHTFQVLTKRPERMAEYTSDPETPMRVGRYMNVDTILSAPASRDVVDGGTMAHWRREGVPWPLPNVWLGTSVEDQRAADERIPHLLRTPAAVRFLSCEPLLGPLTLDDVRPRRPDGSEMCSLDALRTTKHLFVEDDWSRNHVDWVITGGESGPNFRPMPSAPFPARKRRAAGGIEHSLVVGS